MSFFKDDEYIYDNNNYFNLAVDYACNKYYEDDLDADQQEAFNALRSGSNVHIAGKAGGGKSYLLKKLKEKMLNTNIVFLGPSALAARNIDGETIHSFFKFPIGPLSKTYIHEKKDV